MALKYLFVYPGDFGEIFDSNGIQLSAATGVTITINGSAIAGFEPVVSSSITDGKTYLQGFAGGSTSTYSAGGATYRVRAVCFPTNLSGSRIAAVALGLEILNILPPATIVTSFNPGPSGLPSVVTFGGGWQFGSVNVSNSFLRLVVDL